jgi:hypothetical protein
MKIFLQLLGPALVFIVIMTVLAMLPALLIHAK